MGNLGARRGRSDGSDSIGPVSQLVWTHKPPRPLNNKGDIASRKGQKTKVLGIVSG
jgi:hypothetical protein